MDLGGVIVCNPGERSQRLSSSGCLDQTHSDCIGGDLALCHGCSWWTQLCSSSTVLLLPSKRRVALTYLYSAYIPGRSWSLTRLHFVPQLLPDVSRRPRPRIGCSFHSWFYTDVAIWTVSILVHIFFFLDVSCNRKQVKAFFSPLVVQN